MAFEKPLGSRDRASHMPENQGGRREEGRARAGGREAGREEGKGGGGRNRVSQDSLPYIQQQT